MQPLPKVVSILAILAAIFGALNDASVLAVVGPKVGAIITVIAVVVAALSHALTGTGGTTKNP